MKSWKASGVRHRSRCVEWHRDGPYRLDEDERRAVRRGIEAADRGEFVSEEELAEFYRRTCRHEQDGLGARR